MVKRLIIFFIDNKIKQRFYILIRAMCIVIFTTSSVYFIANKYYIAAVCTSCGISTMWTLNVRDLAMSSWVDRLVYIIGSTMGTAISLFTLNSTV